jgi:tetratricopeptide (TPR) repeat protein
MRKHIFFVCILILSINSFAQSFQKQFNELFARNDTTGQRELLKKWENTNINDPELYVAYFNYYVNLSAKEIITIGNQPPQDDYLELSPKDSTNKRRSYLYSDVSHDESTLKKGFWWIDRGIEKFPDRLDMRFGKVYMYGRIKDYEAFTSEIISAIDRSAQNDNKWLWTENKTRKDAKEMMLGSIQDYQLQLYNTGDDGLLKYMKRVAEAVLKYYPDHVESLSDLSIVYMLSNEPEKGLEQLLKAEKIAPKDVIVLGNIAHAYELRGQKDNCLKYYDLVIKYGNKEDKQFARTEIDRITKK